MTRTMPRVLLLLFSLSVLTLVFVARCGFNLDGQPSASDRSYHQLPTSDIDVITGHLKQVLRHREARYSQERKQLLAKIQTLETQIRSIELDTANSSTSQMRQVSTLHPSPYQPASASAMSRISEPFVNSSVQDMTSYFLERLQSAEIMKGVQFKTEYEIYPFSMFNLTRIYILESGLGKRVVEKPIGNKKNELYEVVARGVDRLNDNRTFISKSVYTLDDFVEGIYRSDPTSGIHYELYFNNKDIVPAGEIMPSYTKIVVFRPFGPPMLVKTTVTQPGAQWIHLILPLSGRVESFRYFMENFANVCIRQDKRVYLTVVYFGSEKFAEVKGIMSAAGRRYGYKHMKLITIDEQFARGRGLQLGALNWKSGNVLQFMCDVDIVFDAEFLHRCRMNSEPGKRVYYPIVFSLYNPKIVYSLQDIPTPSLSNQQVISADTGFWRYFGYGMTCQYRSDFLIMKGFDEQIQGWDEEDRLLYQRFVRSEYLVVRATDPGIFHLWHERVCDPRLRPEQYRSCIYSKALTEASHSQLGLLAFKDEMDIHRNAFNREQMIEHVIL